MTRGSLFALDGVAPRTPGDGRFWIAPGAAVIGDVVLGDEVGVWFGAVLRGDNATIVVGARTNVQDGAVVHVDAGFPATIGTGCTIGHRALVHGCTVGDNTLIGMGAAVLNGAVIGRHCLLGAGALVPEGRTIPDGSLAVGAPAKVVRALDPAEIARLRLAAEGYVRNWRRFAAGLAPAD